MKIILLTGLKNSGKTTTLNDVYTRLTKGMQNPPEKEPIKDGSPTDFECVIPYKNKHIYQHVAIYSMGDKQSRNYDTIVKYCGAVDVLILAHSTDGTGKMGLPAVITANKQHHLILKKTADDADNAAACQSIISSI